MITRQDIINTHQAKVLAAVAVEKIKAKKFTVALDSVNGAGGEVAELLLQTLGCNVTTIHRQTDISFERPAEPLPANLAELGKSVVANKADIGLATDPDADRLVLVDETGTVLSEEYTLALAVKQVLSKTPGLVVINLSTSNTTAAVATLANCQTMRTAVGEMNVSKGIMEYQAVIGGEGNGGVIYPRVNLARDSFVGMALVLELMASTGKTLSTLASELPKFIQKKDKVNFKGNLTEALATIKSTFPEATPDQQDGLRLDWPNGSWLQIRASNTEPIVRLIAESKSADEVDRLLNKTKEIILNIQS